MIILATKFAWLFSFQYAGLGDLFKSFALYNFSQINSKCYCLIYDMDLSEYNYIVLECRLISFHHFHLQGSLPLFLPSLLHIHLNPNLVPARLQERCHCGVARLQVVHMTLYHFKYHTEQ